MTPQFPQIVVAAPPRLPIAPVILQWQSLQGDPKQMRLFVGKVAHQINGFQHEWSPVEGDIRVVNHETAHEIEITEHESVGSAARRVMEATTGIAQAQFLAALQKPLRMASGHGGDDLDVEVPFYIADLSAENLRIGTGDALGGLRFSASELVDLRTFRGRINSGATPERIVFHNRLAAITGRVLTCIAACYKEGRLRNPLNDLPRLVQAKLGKDFTGEEFRPAWGLVNPSAPVAPPRALRTPSAAPAP